MNKPLTPNEHVTLNELNQRQKDYKPLDDYQIDKFAELIDHAIAEQIEPLNMAMKAQQAYWHLLTQMIDINSLLIADLRYWKERSAV